MKNWKLLPIVCLLLSINTFSQSTNQYIDLDIFYIKKKADSLFMLKEYVPAFKQYHAIENKKVASARDYYRAAVCKFYLGEVKKSEKYLQKSLKAGHLYNSESRVKGDTFLRIDQPFINEFRKKVIGSTIEHIVPSDPQLLDTLIARRKSDQFYRTNGDPEASPKTKDSLLNLLRQSDKNNQDWLLSTVAKNGLPGYSEVGYDGDNAVWLIIQHADNDTNFQKKYLVLIKDEVRKNNSNPNNYAYLVDRILINTGYPQIFGTQFIMNNVDSNITVSLKPVQNEFLLDCLRSNFDLPPIKDYLRMSTEYLKKKYGKR